MKRLSQICVIVLTLAVILFFGILVVRIGNPCAYFRYGLLAGGPMMCLLTGSSAHSRHHNRLPLTD
jgi:MFS-type transporter involved in bile tolerance (Atg22 family)